MESQIIIDNLVKENASLRKELEKEVKTNENLTLHCEELRAELERVKEERDNLISKMPSSPVTKPPQP